MAENQPDISILDRVRLLPNIWKMRYEPLSPASGLAWDLAEELRAVLEDSSANPRVMLCSICPWVDKSTPAVTVINGHAVCREHHRSAHLAADHRHAVVLAGGRL